MPASIFSETELATLHALRRFLFFAHQGKVQRRQADQQTNQVLCLNWVTNAIVTWNTVYMNAAIERLRAEGRIGRDIDLGHLSPALYGHVNPYVRFCSVTVGTSYRVTRIRLLLCIRKQAYDPEKDHLDQEYRALSKVLCGRRYHV